MSKNELRSSGERRRRAFANGASEPETGLKKGQKAGTGT